MGGEETDEVVGMESGVTIVVGGLRGAMLENLAIGVSLVVQDTEYGGGGVRKRCETGEARLIDGKLDAI